MINRITSISDRIDSYVLEGGALGTALGIFTAFCATLVVPYAIVSVLAAMGGAQ